MDGRSWNCKSIQRFSKHTKGFLIVLSACPVITFFLIKCFRLNLSGLCLTMILKRKLIGECGWRRHFLVRPRIGEGCFLMG